MGVTEDFLNAHKISELPLKKGQVYEATTGQSLDSAFKVLADNHILSVPVWDEAEKKYIGFLDVRDLVAFAVFATEENNAAKTLEEILRHGVKAQEKASEAVSVKYLAKRNPFRPVKMDASLGDVARMLAAGAHRVPVVNDEGRVSNIISQSLMMEYLAQHQATLGDFASKTIASLDIGSTPVISVRENDSALHAFKTLDRIGRSGLAVVDVENRLVGVTSGSDLKLYLSRGETLNQPIFEFLKKIRQADLKTRAPTFTCSMNDTVGRVMGLMQATQAHRLIVVNEHHHPLRVVSIQDVLRCALKH